MNILSMEQQINELVVLTEKFPEKFQPVILAELLRRDQSLGISAPTRIAKEQKRVEVQEPHKAKKQINGTHGKILELRNAGFLDEPKTDIQVVEELDLQGFRYPRAQIATGLRRLTRAQELRRLKDSKGKRAVYKYQNPLNN